MFSTLRTLDRECSILRSGGFLMTELETKAVLAGIQRFEDAARTLRDVPELRPVARRMLGALLQVGDNGYRASAPESRKAVSKKLHWTQRPENRGKVMKLANKMQRANKKKQR